MFGIRGACELLITSRSMYSYKSLRSEQVFLWKRIREIAETKVRYGYKRIHTLLRREGWGVNYKRGYRIYCEEGLQMRNETPKRRFMAKLREFGVFHTAVSGNSRMKPYLTHSDLSASTGSSLEAFRAG